MDVAHITQKGVTVAQYFYLLIAENKDFLGGAGEGLRLFGQKVTNLLWIN